MRAKKFLGNIERQLKYRDTEIVLPLYNTLV